MSQQRQLLSCCGVKPGAAEQLWAQQVKRGFFSLYAKRKMLAELKLQVKSSACGVSCRAHHDSHCGNVQILIVFTYFES